jgi:hypothetical protein
MRKGLLFDDVADFADFVRVCGATSSSKAGYALHVARHPERPAGPPALLLGGWRQRKEALPPGLDGEPIALRPVEFEEDADAGALSLRLEEGAARIDVPLLRRVSAKSLLELVELAPWRGEPAAIGCVVLWLSDPALLPKIATDCLKLGNDRLQFALIDAPNEDGAKRNAGREASATRALLLRIESPPWFVLQRCLEEIADDVAVFLPASEDLHVAWGWRHPLEDLWLRSTRPRKGDWLFFRPGAPRLRVSPPAWRDLYDAASFELEFDGDPTWLQSDGAATRFSVPLRLAPRVRPVEPELWLLRESDRPALERLLWALDQEELDKLLLAVHDDANGERFYFLRERHDGRGGRSHLDFGGERFASYKGFPNLFLPADLELQPQLRRDRYRSIFGLEHGDATVLLASGGDAPRVVRFAEKSFEPLSRLVDHLLDASLERLKEISAKTHFDLGDYALAPSRPDLLKGEAPRRSPSKKASKEEPNRVDAPAPEVDEPKQTRLVAVKVVDAKLERTELELREAELERDVVKTGSLEAWSGLASVKESLGKWGDASACRVEALWLVEAEAEAAPRRAKLRDCLDRWSASLAAESSAEQPAKALAAAAGQTASMRVALAGDETPKERLDGWLREASRELRSVEGRLRVKERWLMWGEVLSRNGDVKEQARVREEIRAQIARDGLGLEQIPLFARNRIFLDRELSEGTDERQEGSAYGDFRAARSNLEIVERALEKVPSEKLRRAGFAILARAIARRLGEPDRAAALLERASKDSDAFEPGLRAWIHLYGAHAAEPHSASSAKLFRDRWNAALKQLKASQKEEAKMLDEVAKSLDAREQTDNPAAFLSRENIERCYPANQAARWAGDEIAEQLRQAREASDTPQAVALVARALDHVARHDAAPGSAKLMGVVAEMIGALKWSADGGRLAEMFDSFLRGQNLDRRAQDLATPKGANTGLYGALLNNNIAQSLLELRREAEAAEIVEGLLRRLGAMVVPLDFVDVCSAILGVVEGLPLARRSEPARLALAALLEQLANPRHNWEARYMAPFALKLLDQAVEAASSKEKLALGRYKDYLRRDEMLILRRALREDFRDRAAARA